MGNESAGDPQPTHFDAGVSDLHLMLDGPRRGEILRAMNFEANPESALEKLLESMRRHRFAAEPGGEPLVRWLRPLERATERDGFHPLQDWDGQLEKLNPDIIPVDVLKFLIASEKLAKPAAAAAIALDYYLLYVLCLMAMRVGDSGDPDGDLDRLNGLLSSLQGPHGSGQQFVTNASSLILLATSHFESDESAFVRLRLRFVRFGARHRLQLALALAPILSSHLRFGFHATYGRDLVSMRKDNAPDYPWLMFALSELMHAYVERVKAAANDETRIDPSLIEALVNGLAPDPKAFLGSPPASLEGVRDQVDGFQKLVGEHGARLLQDIEPLRPSDESYSPIAFFFNFPHNLLKAMVVDSASHGVPSPVSVNDLLAGESASAESDEARKRLITTLLEYADASPDRIRGRPTPIIAYDVRRGRRAFAGAQKVLEDSLERGG